MKLKTRLIITFFTIIFVPLALTGLALLGFTHFQLQSLEDEFGVTNATYSSLGNSIQLINSVTTQYFEQMQEVARENPDQFLDQDYQEEWNSRLRSSPLI